jgi:hypothetical protein
MSTASCCVCDVGGAAQVVQSSSWNQDYEHGKLSCPHVGSAELLMEMNELAARGSEDGEGRKLGIRSLRENETVRLHVQVQRDDAMARRRASRDRQDMRRQDDAHPGSERHATARRRASMDRQDMRRQDGARPGPERHATARRRASRSGETYDGKTARVQVQGDMRRQDGALPGPERHATARLHTSRSGETCDGKTARVQVERDMRRQDGVCLCAAGWMLGFLVYFVQFGVVVCVEKSRFEKSWFVLLGPKYL